MLRRWHLILLITEIVLLSLFLSSCSQPIEGNLLGVDLGDLKKSELSSFLEIMEERWLESPLSLKVNGLTISLNKKELGISWNIEAMKRFILKGEGETVPLMFSWDEEKVKSLLDDLAQKTYSTPEDARLEEKRVIPSREGKRLDEERAILELREALSRGKEEITLTTFQLLQPKIDTSIILEKLGTPHLLVRYQTSLEGKDEPTVYNIQKASSSINGYILEKGEIFSFNNIVGRAEKEDGYLETNIMVNGRLSPGYGGGVCQVSSTLYNALLGTEAQILERHPHSGYSETTSYVPPGRDAAVSYGSKDLRFFYPAQKVVIFAYLQEESLICEIWGEKENSLQKTWETQIVSLERKGEKEGLLTVETTVRNGEKIEYRYQDTYLIPWELEQKIKEEFQ
jgi:vancomycin resistance protein YoaR